MLTLVTLPRQDYADISYPGNSNLAATPPNSTSPILQWYQFADSIFCL